MIALVRVRGSIDVKWDIKDTFRMLNLKVCNQAVLLPENDSTKGMIQKVMDYSTFGQVNEKTLAKLLEKRGRIAGNKRLTLEFLKSKKISGFEALAKELIAGKASLRKLEIKPVFRLAPPKKGFERQGIKKAFGVGGALGNRKEKINELIERMM